MGLSIRAYAAHRGVSHTSVRKAIASGRLTPEADGTIDPVKADRAWVRNADPSKARDSQKLKAVPEAAVAAVGDTLREHGFPAPVTSGGMTFLQAKTANEVMKAQERRILLQKLKGEVVERARAEMLMFRLAREERDAWVSWPARIAALVAAELSSQPGSAITVEPALVQRILEAHVRSHLESLSEIRTALARGDCSV